MDKPIPPNVEPATARGSWQRMALSVLWPAFLGAGVLEALVFALVDPAGLRHFGGEACHVAATTVYSVSFLVFWLVVAGACSMAQWLASSVPEPLR